MSFHTKGLIAKEASQMIEVQKTVAMLFQQYRSQPISFPNDVTVNSHPGSVEDKICVVVSENKKVVPITVKNSGTKTFHLRFWACDSVQNIFTITDCEGHNFRTILRHILGPGEEYQILVHFCSHDPGFYEQLLVFSLETYEEPAENVDIIRLLEVTQTSIIKESIPHGASPLWEYTKNDIKGRSLLKCMLPLPPYKMPSDIKSISDEELRRPLTWKNYCDKFHSLLYLEEFGYMKYIKKYNQTDVPLFRYKQTNLLFLEISGVSVDSPMVLSGVQALVTPLKEPKTHKVWVHHVRAAQVFLESTDMFLRTFTESMRVNINFIIDRMPVRYQHRAVELAPKHNLKEVLFPSGMFSSCNPVPLRMLNSMCNEDQQKAVCHIVAGAAKPAPYLLFGPPGTGKTVTLVEAIQQIIKTKPSAHILACAPSNSSADHLFEKILEGGIGTHQAHRLYALSFPAKNIPNRIRFFCNLNNVTNSITIPPKNLLLRYKIIVTTLQTAGRLVAGEFPMSHFNYIIVDEAGQATEMECIVPISGLMKPKECQVVLAGDPKQLGPIVTNRRAGKHGLAVSLLERLMRDFPIYSSHRKRGYNNQFITHLKRNYRSHPAILNIPNELFYQGVLQACAKEEDCNSFCEWKHLPTQGFPLIFHGVAGTKECDEYSPSFYNMAEVEIVKDYLKRILDHYHSNGVTDIKPGQVGIISPYLKQVEKIQGALGKDSDLKETDFENILIGTVEKFQGKEFNVILLSTVRSMPKVTTKKQQFTLGFVDDKKRCNVALTRAQALLIVVGDPRILQTDPQWKRFIHYCYQNGAYRGITLLGTSPTSSY